MCRWKLGKSIQRDLPAIYRTSTGSPMMNTQMKSTRTTNTVLPPPANIVLLAISSFLSWMWNTYYESNKVQTIKCKQVNVNTSNKRTLQAVLNSGFWSNSDVLKPEPQIRFEFYQIRSDTKGKYTKKEAFKIS